MTCPRKQGSILLSVIRSLKGVIWCHRLRKHRSEEPKRRTRTRTRTMDCVLVLDFIDRKSKALLQSFPVTLIIRAIFSAGNEQSPLE